MKLIPAKEHPSCNDKTARLVASDRGMNWSVYSVRGGFVASIPTWPVFMAIEGLFDCEQAAIAAAHKVTAGWSQ